MTTLSLERSWMESLAFLAEYGLHGLRDHLERVSKGSERLAQLAGLSGCEAEQIGVAALAHDVGKLALPRELWFKPGRFEAKERMFSQWHAERGREMMERVGELGLPWLSSPLMALARDICGSHHENWDGSGYPVGLSGESIPLAGRIVKILDVTDALLEKRPYKEAWQRESVFKELAAKSGSEFDPALMETWLEKEDGFEWLCTSFYSSSSASFRSFGVESSK